MPWEAVWSANYSSYRVQFLFFLRYYYFLTLMMNTEMGAEAKRKDKICHRKERMAERRQRKTSAWSEAIAYREFEEADT